VTSAQVGRRCIPGLDLSFSQPVTVSLFVGSAYNGYCLSIQSLPDGGLAWANETSCTVTNGCVTFTVDHATRFVANLTKASVPRPSITKLSSTSAKRGAIVTIQIVRVEALADRLLEGRPYQLD
jgi:hypothetical protein